MGSGVPKVLMPLGGVPLYLHVVEAVSNLDDSFRIAVVGYQSSLVRQSFDESGIGYRIVEQSRRLGTAHAVGIAIRELSDFDGQVLVLYGDTPFLTSKTVEKLLETARKASGIAVLGFEATTASHYGRLVIDEDRTLNRIVEFKDATPAELRISHCNSGILCASGAILRKLLPYVSTDNASREYYLTDIVGIGRARGIRSVAVWCDEEEAVGVNSLAELVQAEALFQRQARRRAIAAGAILTAPETVFFSLDTFLAAGVRVEPNVVFGRSVRIERNACIRAFSHLEGCWVDEGAIVGPYARIRPETIIGRGSKIGNFVEIKASEIGEGARIQHLTYVGDTKVGSNTNVGAGSVVCNYDGRRKHRTVIGENAFIGSGTMLVAPLRIGHGAITAAGSVITDDVPDHTLSIARGRQSNKPGYARRLPGRGDNSE